MPNRTKKSRAKKKQWEFKTPLTAHRTFRHANEISVRASYSQADRRFSIFSRDKQCVANSLMFLAHLHDTQEMDQEKLNHVLIKGDELYCQIRHNLEAKNMFVSIYLSFDEIPNRLVIDQRHYNVIKSTPESGYVLQDAPEGLDNFLNLSVRLESLGNLYSKALLLVGTACISIFRDSHGQYGFFDPHSRNASGTNHEENGKAVMVSFHSVSDLTNRLLQLFYGSFQLHPHQQYDLLPNMFSIGDN